VFIAGVNDTGDKLITVVNQTGDTGDEALSWIFIDSVTSAINLSPVTRAPAMKHMQQYQLAYTSK
jgi:hypothetical protein